LELQILNPVANVKRSKVARALRLQNFNGKTIGLYWNGKPGGKALLDQTAVLLKERFERVTFKEYIGAGGAQNRQTTKEQADAMAKECHAIVAATAD
jgi:hypothetical protein